MDEDAFPGHAVAGDLVARPGAEVYLQVGFVAVASGHHAEQAATFGGDQPDPAALLAHEFGQLLGRDVVGE